MTLWEIYKKGLKILKQSNISDYKTDVLCIFQDVFKINRQNLIFCKNFEVADNKKINKFFKMLHKRKKNLPLQYILGYWYFMDIKLSVGKGVLIPRNDTEVLVTEGIKSVLNLKNPQIVDLCSGSGAIAIALERNLQNNPKITAIEISKKAFFYLEKNISLTKSAVIAINDNIFDFCQTFADDSIDLIICNPPYIPTKIIKKLAPEIQFEPQIALDGGIDGLDFYKLICKTWTKKLKPGGNFAFEIGIGQYIDITKILNNFGFFNIKIKKDINNIERVIIAEKSISE
jgi:release factor glutamine methyltransferase